MKTAVSLFALATMACTVPAYAMPTDKDEQTKFENPTVEDAENFVSSTEKKMFDYSIDAARIYWINATYINDDTDALAAKAGAEGTVMSVKAAIDSAQFKDLPGIDPVTRRKLDMLRGGIILPAPAVPGAATELNEIATKLNSAYGKGTGTLNGKEINGSDIEAAMGTNRNPDELAEMWESWHSNVGAPMKDDYARMVEIANEGAQDLGFADVGAMWRSGYDMPADDFAKLTDKLWSQVKPLYDELH
ncbi:Peptidyl-dipeptidase A precursor, partial [hydrothermal vent metagenome]